MLHKVYPLTRPQKGRWYIEKFYPETSIGNIGGLLIINGDIDYDLLQKAINIFLQKNEGARLRIIDLKDPKQYVSEFTPRHLDFIDFTKDPEALQDWATIEINNPIDLINNDLFYFALVKIDDEKGGILAKFHHLVCDAWTMTLTGNQIMENYYLLIQGKTATEEKRPSYLDWIEYEKEYLNSKRFEKSRKFWNEEFESLPELATLKPRTLYIKNTEARRKSYALTEKKTSKNSHQQKKQVQGKN